MKAKKTETPHDLEMQRLDALQSLNIMDTDPEESYERLVRLAIDLFNIPICFISFLNEERQWFKALHGLNLKQIPRRISFCNETIKRMIP